jgi:flavin reductase (DIM6/NTAB) family NADH-FMN oxidoreductase RutF
MRRSDRKAKEITVSTDPSGNQGATVHSTVVTDLPGSHSATVHSTSAEGFNTRELRNALGSFATGVTIITTRDRDGKLHGMTANSFSSVSLNPPLVLWSSSLFAQSLPAFQEGSHFVVNILAFDQIELSNKFAKQSDDKFIDTDHVIAGSGAPVIIGAAAHFDCRNEFRHYGGDHIIFIGHVERFAYTDRPTLLFCRGKYMRGEPILQS